MTSQPGLRSVEPMSAINIQVGQFRFIGVFEAELAPFTCARFAELLPVRKH